MATNPWIAVPACEYCSGSPDHRSLQTATCVLNSQKKKTKRGMSLTIAESCDLPCLEKKGHFVAANLYPFEDPVPFHSIEFFSKHTYPSQSSNWSRSLLVPGLSPAACSASSAFALPLALPFALAREPANPHSGVYSSTHIAMEAENLDYQ